MQSKDQLAEALRGAGLLEMAKQATEGYYHDFLSPLALPDLQLLNDLRAAQAQASGEQRDKITSLIARHSSGEFDATLGESEEWAKSPDGQDAFNKLKRGL